MTGKSVDERINNAFFRMLQVEGLQVRCGNDNEADMQQERRKEPRRPAFWDAKIGFKGRPFRINCMVQNISSGGAKLALRQMADLPDEFKLTIACRQERLEYGVRTKWRIRRTMGVEIVRRPQLRSATAQA
jgi:PilZ domain